MQRRAFLSAIGLMGLCTQALGASPEAFSQSVERELTGRLRAAKTERFGKGCDLNSRIAHLYTHEDPIVERGESLIAAARTEILLQTRAWHEDCRAAKTILSALKRRTEEALADNDEPLVIRILLGHGGLWSQQHHHSGLSALIKHIQSHPRAPGRVGIELSQTTPALWDSIGGDMLIVDRARLFMTTHAFLGKPPESSDALLLLAGEWTGDIVESLRHSWFIQQKQARLRLRGPATSIQEPICAKDPLLHEPSGTPGCVLALGLSEQKHHGWLERHPSSSQQTMMTLIHIADSHVEIINPTLEQPALVDAMATAILQRGVQVRMLLGLERPPFGGPSGPYSSVVGRVQKLLSRLLAVGGDEAADRLHIAWASVDGRRPSGALAAQAVNLDDQCLWLGAIPFDNQPWHGAHTTSVATIGPDIAKSFSEEVFNPQWSTAIPLDAHHLTLSAAEGLWPASIRGAYRDPVVSYLRRKTACSPQPGP